MQIDFHHTVTYVLARLAGFDKSEANITAYAAQWVDDATSPGTVCFDNKALYQPSALILDSIEFFSAASTSSYPNCALPI